MPLPGWQVAFGQLLTPVVFTVAAQWLFLLAWGMASLAVGQLPVDAKSWVGVFGLVLLTPPVAMLVLCLPFAGVLWFPAWAGAISARGGGFEVAGQRVVFGIVFMVGLFVALLPAALIGGGVRLVGGLLGHPVAGLLFGALAATAVVVAETRLGLRSLGHRIERFDLSQESG
jgi:ABC-2 type transport system permease protein